MKTIAHHHQKQVPLPIDKTQTIQAIVIIIEAIDELSHFESNQVDQCWGARNNSRSLIL
jgi:hypothetical protein